MDSESETVVRDFLRNFGNKIDGSINNEQNDIDTQKGIKVVVFDLNSVSQEENFELNNQLNDSRDSYTIKNGLETFINELEIEESIVNEQDPNDSQTEPKNSLLKKVIKAYMDRLDDHVNTPEIKITDSEEINLENPPNGSHEITDHLTPVESPKLEETFGSILTLKKEEENSTEIEITVSESTKSEEPPKLEEKNDEIIETQNSDEKVDEISVECTSFESPELKINNVDLVSESLKSEEIVNKVDEIPIETPKSEDKNEDLALQNVKSDETEKSKIESNETLVSNSQKSIKLERCMSLICVQNVDDFKSIISNGESLVHYSASWCHPSKLIEPLLRDLAKHNPGIKFINIDIDEARKTLPDQVAHIQSVPFFELYHNGEKLSEFLGDNMVKIKKSVKILNEKYEDNC